MGSASATRELVSLLRSPFRDAGWKSKLGIMLALGLAGMVIPVIPGLFVWGYLAEVLRRARANPEEDLPEWKDWGKLAMDGLCFFGAGLIWMSPFIILFGIITGGYIFYFIALMGLTNQGNSAAPGAIIGMFGSLGVVFLGIGLMLLILPFIALFSPPSLAHVVVKNRFSALFAVGEWWALLKANFLGYIVFLLVALGIYTLLQLVTTALYLTLVLLPLVFFLLLVTGPYIKVVLIRMMGLVYREAEENLSVAAARQA